MIDRDYGYCQEVVEECMEWIGKRWTKSQIKKEMREKLGENLSARTCQWVITQAKREIRRLYNIDPKDYKGKNVEFYESVIRDKRGATKDKLTAAERLDKLLGLENLSGADPAMLAKQILEFKKAALATVGGQKDGDKGNENKIREDGGAREDDATSNTTGVGRNTKTTEPVPEPVPEDVDFGIEGDSIPSEIEEEVRKLSEEVKRKKNIAKRAKLKNDIDSLN